MSTTTQPAGTGVSGLYVKLTSGEYQPVLDTSGYLLDVNLLSDTKDIATTGTENYYVTSPIAGVVSDVIFAGEDALAANDSNYVTFTMTNLGQAGAGSTVMLAATDANTSKATGGTAIVANGHRHLTLNGTAANLVVAAGDRIRISVAATGTLANQVTDANFLVHFAGA